MRSGASVSNCVKAHVSSRPSALHQTLLCGASLLVLACATNAFAGDPLRIVSQGADGEVSTLVKDATVGEPGQSVSATVDYPITAVADSAIELGSRGGHGGWGIYYLVINRSGAKGAMRATSACR